MTARKTLGKQTRVDVEHQINPYAGNFHFQISDNLADFFFPDRQHEQNPEEYAQLKEQSKSASEQQWIEWATKAHDAWDNGIWYGRNGQKKRSDPYGPPWYFPSVRLALNKNLFRPKDLDIFESRAKLEQARAYERIASREADAREVGENAGRYYDQHGVGGITRDAWIRFQVREWSEFIIQMIAVADMGRAFVDSIDAIRQIRMDRRQIGMYVNNEITPEDIDVFQRMKDVSVTDAEWMNIMRNTDESTVKRHLCELLGDPIQKDSGVEQADHITSAVLIGGRRVHAAFLLKGPAGGSLFREMKPKHLGKNGDQIYRMAATTCELLVVQHCHNIGEAVRSQLRDAVANSSLSRQYCLIDGKSTFRILRAYGKV